MGEQGRVLVVDDEETVLITMEAVLARDGYSITTAGSVATAVGVAQAQEFEVAVLDMHLDDGEGLEVLEALHTRQPHCSAIVLTGYASLETAVAAIHHGAYEYLMKPCDIEQLRRTVARGVEQSHVAKSAIARVAALEAALEEASAARDKALAELERLTKG